MKLENAFGLSLAYGWGIQAALRNGSGFFFCHVLWSALRQDSGVDEEREAFHERGGFCTGPSEYLNRLVSSETLDGLRPRLARKFP